MTSEVLRAPALRNQRAKRTALVHALLARTVKYSIRLFLLAWVLVPFAALLLVSVQSKAEALSTPPDWLPSIDLSNFVAIIRRAFAAAPPTTSTDYIWPGIQNSLVVATGVAVVNLAVGSLGGYAFARYRMPGRRSIPLAMLASQMVPPFAIIVPYFVVLRNLNLTNTRAGVMVALLSVTVPFTVWLMRAYFENIPLEIERAGRIDGCGRVSVFFRVVLPLARPGLISVGLFAFMVAWNDFLFAIILNSSNEEIMVQPAIAALYNIREQSFGVMAAGTILAAIPTMLLALYIQRFLIKGLLSGAGKG